MKRRSFLSGAAAGVAAGIASAPAIVQANTTINWRLASSFPKSLDTIFGAAEIMAKRVSALTDGKFNIRVFPGGELVPALQVMDAVQAGTVEMGHSASYYYFGKDATFAFDTAVPFGLTARQQTAWIDQGGGRQLMRDFFAEYGVVNFMGGNTGCQMGGWFRREVKTPQDLHGLKMRVGGFAGRVMQKLGVVPQQIAGGDIYPALEKGTIDAAEWIGPYDDEKLGFNKVAPFYYTPGWWEPSAQLSFYVNKKEWDKLPKEYQAALEVATYEAHIAMQAMYDARNPGALARLMKNGVKLRTFSKSILDACYEAAQEVIEEEASKNAKFKKVLEPWRRFHQDQNNWYSVAESPVQAYLIGRRKS
jgi:TRAP-type mannitol/chloroaromatic compound transport system substrate-binding protein